MTLFFRLLCNTYLLHNRRFAFQCKFRAFRKTITFTHHIIEKKQPQKGVNTQGQWICNKALLKSIKQKNKVHIFFRKKKRKMQGGCVEIFEQVQGTATNDGSSGMRRSTWSCRLFGCLTPSKRSSLRCPCCRWNLLDCCWVGLSLALDDDVSVVSVPILVRLFFVHDVLSETKKKSVFTISSQSAHLKICVVSLPGNAPFPTQSQNVKITKGKADMHLLGVTLVFLLYCL